MKEVLIIGCGFSGIAMATELEMRNISYMVADTNQKKSATFISGGLVNPVSGRKYSLQFKYQEIASILQSRFDFLQNLLNASLIRPARILKIHTGEDALTDWQKKSKSEETDTYITDEKIPADYARFLDFRYGHLIIRHAFQINTKLLVTQFTEWLAGNDRFIETEIGYSDIKIHRDHFEYKGETFKRIIFCEGIHCLHNPWFKNVEFKPAKGECMLVEIPNFKTNDVIQKGIILIPYGENLFWAGATNTWNDLSTESTEDGIHSLENLLNQLIKTKYNIIEKYAAIRPSTRDRVPVAGSHPEIRNLFILNGMGTKGASRSWYYAKHLAAHIFEGAEIDSRASVHRFFK